MLLNNTIGVIATLLGKRGWSLLAPIIVVILCGCDRDKPRLTCTISAHSATVKEDSAQKIKLVRNLNGEQITIYSNGKFVGMFELSDGVTVPQRVILRQKGNTGDILRSFDANGNSTAVNVENEGNQTP